MILVAQCNAVSYEPCKVVLIGSSPLRTWMVAKCTMLCAVGCAVLFVKLANAIVPVAVYDSKHLACLEWHLDNVLVG